MSFLEEFWGHVCWGACILHRTFANISLSKNKIIKNVTNFTPYTYREFSEAKIADLDVEVAVNEHIVTLDVPMDDSEVVHVLKHDRSVDGDLKPLT